MTLYICRRLSDVVELPDQMKITGCTWDTILLPLPDDEDFVNSHCQYICPEAKSPCWEKMNPSTTITRRVSKHGHGLSFYIDRNVAEAIDLKPGDKVEATITKISGSKDKKVL